MLHTVAPCAATTVLYPLSGQPEPTLTVNALPLPSSITTQTISQKSFGQRLSPYGGFALSAALITYGVVAQNAPALQNLNSQLDAFAHEKFPRRFHLDDWLQYAPTAAYLGLDIAGVQGRHPFLQRTAVAATAFIFMATFVNVMKWSIPVLRPDGSAWNSFPSGHTATAFTGAHLLGKEYGKQLPWVSAAGYVAATTTGLGRIANKRHWLSDVVAGAGIGILSVELAWLLMPVFDRWFDRWQNPSSDSIDFAFAPSLANNSIGASIVCTF